VRHRHPQSIATRGLIAGSPLSACTGGAVQPRNRFKVERIEKSGVAGALDYTYTFSTTVDALDAEKLKGEYVDDLAVLTGTLVA
jgi:hypothetical protein